MKEAEPESPDDWSNFLKVEKADKVVVYFLGLLRSAAGPFEDGFEEAVSPNY